MAWWWNTLPCPARLLGLAMPPSTTATDWGRGWGMRAARTRHSSRKRWRCADEAFVQETVALVADECTQDEHDLEVVVADAGHLVCALAAAAALVAFVATVA